jgi:hypothetical protein
MPLPADRLPADLRTLYAKVADLERQIRELRAARTLEHASIDSGALTIRDASGGVAATFGNQADGTVALSAVTGPPPPPPTAPTVGAQLAALSVTWDGAFAGGAPAPADWLRVEIHVAADPAFIPSQTTLRATIQNLSGGTALIALAYSTWNVKLRSVTTSGAVSDPTIAVAGTPRQAGGGDISADAIDGKTITGAVIRTASSGRRIVLNEGDDNTITVYDSSGNVVAYFGGDGGSVEAFDQSGTNYSWSVEGSTMSWLSGFSPQMQVYAHDSMWFLNTILAGGIAFKNGHWLKLTPGSDTPVTWTAPTMSTGWATGPVAGGGSYPPLKYKLLPNDCVHVFGSFHATVASPTSPIATGFPTVNFTNTGGVGVAGVAAKIAAGSTYIPLYLNDTGQLRAAATPTIASGDTFMINAIVPLGQFA